MPDTPVTLSAAFLIGLFSSLHCIGMCGSIIGALSLSLPASIRNNQLKRLVFINVYNIGRLSSYTFAGMIAGGIGFGLLSGSGLAAGHVYLRTVGTVMMLAIGMYLAGWLPQLSYFEKAGVPVWRWLEPVGRKMLPVDNVLKALVYGMVWGWLPCGLVYTVLLWSLTAGSAVNGALVMLAFGLGTLPTLVTAGIMTSWLTRFAQSTTARRVVGIIIILMAIGSQFIPVGSEHAHHLH